MLLDGRRNSFSCGWGREGGVSFWFGDRDLRERCILRATVWVGVFLTEFFEGDADFFFG